MNRLLNRLNLKKGQNQEKFDILRKWTVNTMYVQSDSEKVYDKV